MNEGKGKVWADHQICNIILIKAGITVTLNSKILAIFIQPFIKNTDIFIEIFV
jgi:hypothetical protein